MYYCLLKCWDGISLYLAKSDNGIIWHAYRMWQKYTISSSGFCGNIITTTYGSYRPFNFGNGEFRIYEYPKNSIIVDGCGDWTNLVNDKRNKIICIYKN